MAFVRNYMIKFLYKPPRRNDAAEIIIKAVIIAIFVILLIKSL